MYQIFHLLSGPEVNSAFHTSVFDQISTRKSWGPNGKKKPIRKEEPWSFVKYVIMHPYFLSVLCLVYVRVLTYFMFYFGVCQVIYCLRWNKFCDFVFMER